MGSTRQGACRRHLTLLCVGLLPSLQACAPAPACPVGVNRTASLTLYFGGSLNDADWRDFAAATLTPAFPDGLTILDAAGQWRDPASGRIVMERTRVVQVFGAEVTARAGLVAAAYRTRFHQVSVGMVTGEACASF